MLSPALLAGWGLELDSRDARHSLKSGAQGCLTRFYPLTALRHLHK